jgi:hypothetical protein
MFGSLLAQEAPMSAPDSRPEAPETTGPPRWVVVAIVIAVLVVAAVVVVMLVGGGEHGPGRHSLAPVGALVSAHSR